MLGGNRPTFPITVNEYFLPLQSNFLVKLKAISHFILQNLGAFDHPVAEMKNYNDRHMAFSSEYSRKITCCGTRKGVEYGSVFL